MKKILNNILKIFIIFLILLTTFSLGAQPPSDPPGGASGIGNNSSNSQGGNAPIGSGLVILLGLGAAYGGRKLYVIKKESLEE